MNQQTFHAPEPGQTARIIRERLCQTAHQKVAERVNLFIPVIYNAGRIGVGGILQLA